MSRKMLNGGSQEHVTGAVRFFTEKKDFDPQKKEDDIKTAKSKFELLRDEKNARYITQEEVLTPMFIAFKSAKTDLTNGFANDEQAEQFVLNKLKSILPPIPPGSESKAQEGGASSDPDASPSPQSTPKKLSDITSDWDIGYTKSDDGTFTPTEGDRPIDRGEKQKKFIIKKSKEINEALKQEGIKERVDKDAITNYNTAMEAATPYLGDFTPIAITGGKRSRRRRSNTRNRRTKNNHKKLYKR